jgi:HSP20 family protein
MGKVSGTKLVVFGAVVAAILGLVAWGFSALKSAIGEGSLCFAAEGEFEGAFGGVGLQITKKDGAIVIVEAMKDKPAQKAGVEAGDQIVKINDEALGDDPVLEDIVKKLRGEPGSEVTVAVKRGEETKSFTIKREKIEVPAPEFMVIRKGPGGIEELEPQELWPFEQGSPFVWGGDKKALEEYREALRRLREAQRKLWRFWGWDVPGGVFRVPPPDFVPEAKEFRMDLDVRETDDAITIKCDMPGMKKEDIDISLKGKLLTIKGSRNVEEETKDEKGKIIRKERRFGSFTRSLTVPGKVKSEDIKTSYAAGVLTIVISKEPPKPEEEEKEIKINIGTI